MDCGLQAFGSLPGSPFTSLWWQMESLQAFGGGCGLSCISFWWHIGGCWWRTWIVVWKPLVAYVDCRLQAFGGLRGSPFTIIWLQMESFTSLWWQMKSFTSLSWQMWIIVYKLLVASVDRRAQAFAGRWSHSQAFRGIRGSSCTRLLVAYVDGRAEAFGGIRGLSFASLLWLTWIAGHKALVADRVINMPFVAYVDRRAHAFCGIRGLSIASLWRLT